MQEIKPLTAVSNSLLHDFYLPLLPVSNCILDGTVYKASAIVSNREEGWGERERERETSRQTQTDREIALETDTKTETDRQAGRQTYRQAHTGTHRQSKTERAHPSSVQ